MSFRFELHHTDGLARLSTFHTPHGPIAMPAFAPVGTQANVKTLEPRDLHESGAQLVLANTYHLYLRPGHELIQRFGAIGRLAPGTGPSARPMNQPGIPLHSIPPPHTLGLTIGHTHHLPRCDQLEFAALDLRQHCQPFSFSSTHQ